MEYPRLITVLDWLAWLQIAILIVACAFALRRRRQTGDRRMTFLFWGLLLLALAQVEGLVANAVLQAVFQPFTPPDPAAMDEWLARSTLFSTINVLLGQALTILGFVFLLLTVGDGNLLRGISQKAGKFWHEGSV